MNADQLKALELAEALRELRAFVASLWDDESPDNEQLAEALSKVDAALFNAPRVEQSALI